MQLLLLVEAMHEHQQEKTESKFIEKVLDADVDALADTLLMESVNVSATVARPAHGVTMDAVVQRFGEPLERKGPVGEPPISHWVYADFVVYFEYDHVVHAVVRR